MKRNRIVVMMLVVVTVLAMATTALAGKPDKPDKPEPPESRTCKELDADDTSWVLGGWVEGHSERGVSVEAHYEASGVPACIDLDKLVEHRNAQLWLVEYSGQARKGTTKGLGLGFKRGLPGEWYAGPELRNPGVAWEPWVAPDDDGPFVFVAMEHHGDKWQTITIKVTPQG